MEIALSTHAGESDVVTPFGSRSEFRRADVDSAVLPQNFLSTPRLEDDFRAAVRNRDAKTLDGLRRETFVPHYLFRNHDSASRAIKRLGRPAWDAAFTFTIERHPYEKAVSMAWMHAGEAGFDQALEAVLAGKKYRNNGLYSVDGKVVVDFVIRYERMADDVAQLEKRLGLEIFARLPNANSEFRRDRRPAAEVLGKAQKSIIQSVCAEEFELFGYLK